jgi:uncharacterized protein (TIGR03435 family)
MGDWNGRVVWPACFRDSVHQTLDEPRSRGNPRVSRRMLEEQRQMLLSLLEERFQFKHHRETREGPVYLLVKGATPLKMSDSKDKNAFPWAGAVHGAVHGGPPFADGIQGINESMEDLARRLAQPLGKPVLDRTTITGSFDFRAEYSPADTRPNIIGVILTSVQELGLKLEPSRGPVDTIVIDHIESRQPIRRATGLGRNNRRRAHPGLT